MDGVREPVRREHQESLSCACERPTHSSMKTGENPTDIFVLLDGQKVRLQNMGEELPGESYEGNYIRRALLKAFDFIR